MDLIVLYSSDPSSSHISTAPHRNHFPRYITQQRLTSHFIQQVQRVMTATSIDHPDRYPEVISALYHAFWAEKKGIQLPEVHYPILASILGEDSATKVLERVSLCRRYSLASNRELDSFSPIPLPYLTHEPFHRAPPTRLKHSSGITPTVPLLEAVRACRGLWRPMPMGGRSNTSGLIISARLRNFWV